MRAHLILAAVAVMGAAGCAAPMALRPGATSAEMGEDGMVLFSTHVANTWKNYEVRAKSVAVQRMVSPEEKARIAAANASRGPYDNPIDDGGGIRLFQVSERLGAGGVPGAYWEQRLVILRLPPGRWGLSHVNLEAGGFPFSGIGWAYVRAPFEVKKGAVTYLGRVAGTRRERTKPNEPMAGPPLPLIDQAVTGFSGGTVDVKVTDQYEADLARARSIYPALQRIEVGKAVMVIPGEGRREPQPSAPPSPPAVATAAPAPPTPASPPPPVAVPVGCPPSETLSFPVHTARSFLCRPDPVRGGHYCESRATLGQFVELAACESSCRVGMEACSTSGPGGAACARCVRDCAETTPVLCPTEPARVDGRPVCRVPAGTYGLRAERAVPAACAAGAPAP